MKGKKLLVAALTVIGLGSVDKSLSTNVHQGHNELQEMRDAVVDDYYINLRKKGEKWYGESDSRDIQLKAMYNAYQMRVIQNKDLKDESKKDTRESFLRKYDYMLDEVKQFVLEVDNFLKDYQFDKEGSLAILNMYKLFKQLLNDSRSDEEVFEIYYRGILSHKELTVSRFKVHYNIEKFRYVEDYTKQDILNLIRINEYAEKIEESGKTTNGILPYIYGNVKLATSRLLMIYAIKQRFTYITDFLQNPSFSKENSVIENLPPRERNQILYSKDGLPFPVLDIGKKNQTMLNLIIAHAQKENISLQLVLAIALKENNFGNNITSDAKAYGPMQIKNDSFKDVMDDKSIKDYPKSDRFFVTLIAGIKYLAKLKNDYGFDLGYNQKIPKVKDYNSLSLQDKKIIGDYLKISSLYYSGIGKFLLEESLNGLTTYTEDYIEKMYSTVFYYYYAKHHDEKEGSYY